ncbi:MAG: 16S rRNA (uracil(1498)-N(3))-methyltransferase [Myxococcota bacterium]|nr:16S rRNA (uracil(1498)-N(3))-methyltransferase [Myxococcota bacterium]
MLQHALMLQHGVASSDEIQITGDEYHYLIHVRRHNVGDAVELKDPDGNRYAAMVARVQSGTAYLTVGNELSKAPKGFPVILMVAVPKRGLMDDIVRKVSELGAARIIPMLTEHTTVRPSQQKLARWRRIAWESRRQCGRESPLEVKDAEQFTHLVSSPPNLETRLILDPTASTTRPFFSLRSPRPPLGIMVGPEGGFSPGEVAAAQAVGFTPVGLGETILRIETAAIAAVVLSVAVLGGFGDVA